ncbi:unnamed protein product [Rotaria sordida]|uniref:Uncharacterized protein n=1 Tax=Rotaria sordida TaxID=392033 RepID=A0A815NCG5_9BILA|nr:unnamed protein product [Rotaria sordida]CAF1633746.1 unnamed protein product [Rotaria sordida]
MDASGRFYPGVFGRAYLSENNEMTVTAHEMGHCLTLSDSYSDDPKFKRPEASAKIGQYDDEWDVMSADHVKANQTKYGMVGPGLNGFTLKLLGWIPKERIYTFGQNGKTSATLNLTTLMNPAPGYPSLIIVPCDPSDLQHYYLIEMRFKEKWDARFDRNSVFIHEVKQDPNKKTKYYRSYLLRARNTTRDSVNFVNMNGVTITTGEINVQTRTVSVKITTTNPIARSKATKRLQAKNYLLLLKKFYAAESEQFKRELASLILQRLTKFYK